MDPIEKAIRNAFAKGDPSDRLFREKVYRSAFAALDRALKANPAVTVEKAIERRKGLQSTITAIETEFVPRPQAPPVPVDDGARVEPTLGGNDALLDAAGRRAAPPRMAGRPDEVRPDPDRRRARRRGRRPLAILFVVATILALLGIGAWWASRTGLLLSPAERDTSVPNPPATLPSEDFAPAAGEGEASGAAPPPLSGEAAPERDWISVFTPDDPASVSAPSGSSAEIVDAEGGRVLRVRSGGEEAAVLFDVGEGLLEQLAGRTAVFEIVARAANEGEETQIAVDCDFGEFGDCGRKRYQLGYERQALLFEVTFPEGRPGAGGTIAIDSDVSDAGLAVDIFAIRVSVAE